MDWLNIISYGVALPVLAYIALIAYGIVDGPSKSNPGSEQHRKEHSLSMKIFTPLMVVACLFFILDELFGWW